MCSGCVCVGVCSNVLNSTLGHHEHYAPKMLNFGISHYPVRVCVCVILTMFLGHLTQHWTPFDPTSHDATLVVTSHGFPQFLSSFSVTGTKIHSDLLVHTHTHTHTAELLTNTNLHRLCVRSKVFSSCLATILVYLPSLLLLFLPLFLAHLFISRPSERVCHG